MDLKIGCVLLASGFSSRFKENKLYKTVDGDTLINRALRSIPSEKLDKIAVVSQYDDIKEKAEKFGFHFIKNQHPDYGLSHTVKLGLEYTSDCDATMFLVSDQPLLKKESVEKMLEFFKRNNSFIVGLGYEGKRGNPCVFPKEFYPQLFKLIEDQGGSTVIRQNKNRLKIFEAKSHLELTDIDTKEDLEKLKHTEV